MTTNFEPEVSLRVTPEAAAAWAAQAADDPVHAIHHAAMAYRLLVIREVSQQVRKAPEMLTEKIVRELLDNAWGLYGVGWTELVAPAMAGEYLLALNQIERGMVDRQVITLLARQHAEKMGRYFHQTSSDALLQGFNTYVNRQVAPRAAFNRALRAFGLTPRQMNGYVALSATAPVQSAQALDPEARVKAYIGRAFEQRLRTFARQEKHNLEEETKQIAWLWGQDHGVISKFAEKMWITERDERVCPVCGPLHRQKVKITERFITENGDKIWAPGVHPNCRCKIRLLDPLKPIRKSVSKAWDAEDIREHPRGNDGRFRTKAREAEPVIRTNIIEPAEEEEEELTIAPPAGLIAVAPPQFSGRIAPPPAEQVEAPLSVAAPLQMEAPLRMDEPFQEPEVRVAPPRVTVEEVTVTPVHDRIPPEPPPAPRVKTLDRPIMTTISADRFDELGGIIMLDSEGMATSAGQHTGLFQTSGLTPRGKHEESVQENVESVEMGLAHFAQIGIDGESIQYVVPAAYSTWATRRLDRVGMDPNNVNVVMDAEHQLDLAWALASDDKTSTFPVDYVTDEGDLVGHDEIPAYEFGMATGIGGETPVTLVIDQAWDDQDRGWTTDNLASDTKYGNEEWRVRGNYRIVASETPGLYYLEPLDD